MYPSLLTTFVIINLVFNISNLLKIKDITRDDLVQQC